MKKVLTLALTLALTLSLAACGGKPAAPATTPAPAPVAPAATPAAPSDIGYTPDQQAAADALAELIARHNAVVDAVTADPTLSQMQELTTIIDSVGTSIAEVNAVFADPTNLTDEALSKFGTVVENGNTFLSQVEAMVANYGGQVVVELPITVFNDTGVDIHGLAMSPSASDSWGGDMLNGAILTNGATGATIVTLTEQTLVWDLLAMDAEGTPLSFVGIDFGQYPEGGVLALAIQDGAYVAGFLAE